MRLALLETGGQAALAADLVQDSLARLVARYRDRPPEEFAPLFHSILRNRITDWRRRTKLERVLGFFLSNADDDDDAPAWESVIDPAPGPEHLAAARQLGARIAAAVAGLSARQRQAFLLREMEGLSIIDSARAMGVSEGSVKTHHLRALTHLRAVLRDESPYREEP